MKRPLFLPSIRRPPSVLLRDDCLLLFFYWKYTFWSSSNKIPLFGLLLWKNYVFCYSIEISSSEKTAICSFTMKIPPLVTSMKRWCLLIFYKNTNFWSSVRRPHCCLLWDDHLLVFFYEKTNFCSSSMFFFWSSSMKKTYMVFFMKSPLWEDHLLVFF